MEIEIDNREPIEYKVKFLESGDIQFRIRGKLVKIERKTIDDLINSMGATITCLEKIRPEVPLERAIMGIQFNEYMAGVQFHPEFKSKPIAPHPLFKEFIRACLRLVASKG